MRPHDVDKCYPSVTLSELLIVILFISKRFKSYNLLQAAAWFEQPGQRSFAGGIANVALRYCGASQRTMVKTMSFKRASGHKQIVIDETNRIINKLISR